MKEIWKDIPNYEGLYQISNLGRIKSLKRYVKNKHGKRIVKEKILTNYINGTGYYAVNLRKECGIDIKRVHRLVAESFIPNPNNLPQVNHIDGNKLNNNIENLEWCNCSYNVKEAFRLGLNKHIDFVKRKEILQFNLKNEFIKEWKSIYDAWKNTNIPRSCINKVCQGKQKTAGNYIWKYKEEV